MLGPTINKIFFDRRAKFKPRWLCTIQGGVGSNSINVKGKGAGCSRSIAFFRAKHEWRKDWRKNLYQAEEN